MATPQEQLATLSTPQWLADVGTKITTVIEGCIALAITIPSFQWTQNGVPVSVEFLDADCLRISFGSSQAGGWQFQLVEPLSWY